MTKTPTSIKLDSQVKAIAEIIGASHQKIYDRGLQALALDGKIKNPKVIAIIIKRQNDVIQKLEIEQMVLEELTKFIYNHNEVNEDQVIVPDQICPYCERNLKNGQCTCQEWRTWKKLRGLV